MRKKLLLAALLTLNLIFVGLACGGPEEQPEFRIGLIAPITGNIPEVGKSSLDSANLIVNEVNQAGGLEVAGKHYKIVLLTEDNEDKAEVTTSKALSLINQQNVIAIVGPQASRNAIPASIVAEVAKIPMISPWSTHPETTRNKKWVFRVGYMDPFQGQVMARFAREELGADKVAVLYDIASEYNRDLTEVFAPSFESLGGEVVLESYTTDTPDVSEQLVRIRESGAEVLFLPNYHTEVPDQVRAAREMGIEATVLGSDTWPLIQDADREVVEGAFFNAHFALDIADEHAQRFISSYRAAYGRDPDDVAALTFDAFGLLFKAVKDQRKVDPDAIRDGLAAITGYRGVTGSFNYNGVGGDPMKSVAILQIKDGEFVFHSRVEP